MRRSPTGSYRSTLRENPAPEIYWYLFQPLLTWNMDPTFGTPLLTSNHSEIESENLASSYCQVLGSRSWMYARLDFYGMSEVHFAVSSLGLFLVITCAAL